MSLTRSLSFLLLTYFIELQSDFYFSHVGIPVGLTTEWLAVAMPSSSQTVRSSWFGNRTLNRFKLLKNVLVMRINVFKCLCVFQSINGVESI